MATTRLRSERLINSTLGRPKETVETVDVPADLQLISEMSTEELNAL